MKRRILSIFLAVVLVMTMTVTALAGSNQVDRTYNGETYTLYVYCGVTKATANIRTTCTTSTIGVAVTAYDDLGQRSYTEVLDRTVQALATLYPDGYPSGNRAFVRASAEYYIDGNQIDYVTGLLFVRMLPVNMSMVMQNALRTLAAHLFCIMTGYITLPSDVMTPNCGQ